MQVIAYAAAALVAGYLVFALLLFAFQRKLLYRPMRERIAPARVGLPMVHEEQFRTADGETLICWHLPPAPGQPTLLYFHGNGGDLAGRRDRFLRCAAAGLGLYMMSYRGYAGSSGEPSERAIIADALAVYDGLRSRESGPLILYGESLGSGVAVQVAAQRTPDAVILEAPYTSIADVAQALYPIIPVRPFLHDRFDSLSRIAAVRAPLLVLHGARDETIPVALGRALFDAAPEPKQMISFPSAVHCDLYVFGAWDVILRFIHGIRQGPGGTKAQADGRPEMDYASSDPTRRNPS